MKFKVASLFVLLALLTFSFPLNDAHATTTEYWGHTIIDSSTTIQQGDIWIILDTATLTITDGAVLTIADGAELINENIITINGGTIANNGTITNNGTIQINEWPIPSSISNNGTIANNDAIRNHGGEIFNYDTLTNHGTIDLAYTGYILNEGGTITNNYNFYVQGSQGFSNVGTVINNAWFNNYANIWNYEGIINNYGSFSNYDEASVHNDDGIINNYCEAQTYNIPTFGNDINEIPCDLIDLGTADTFAVLGHTITNTELTAVDGDVGSTLGGHAAVIGSINGINHNGDEGYHIANADLKSAIATVQSFPDSDCTTISTASVQLGANSYGPGIHCINSAANITGELTLSGEGIYIFKINGLLTTAAGAQITLVGPTFDDIFWVVDGTTVIGAGNDFSGTIMSNSAVTIGAGSAIDGRVLTSGALTIGTSTINSNGPSIPLVLLPIELGDAKLFGLLANTIANTLSTVDGHIGDVTGTHTVTASGQTFTNIDNEYNDAQIALTSALDDAQSKPCDTVDSLAVDLAILDYGPGVHCIGGAATNSAELTLVDGPGVYLFKIYGALSTAADSTVELNGATADDVFWRVGGATSIGTNSDFAGILMTDNAVTVGIGATVDGCVLTTGPAIISASTITCTTPPAPPAPPVAAPIDLGVATTFGLLANTITNTLSHVNGDIGNGVGIHTVTAEFPGQIYTNDSKYTNAQADLTSAINDAQSRTCDDYNPAAVVLSGTYSPGVHCIGGAATISGELTLDGPGVYIFKISGAFAPAANSNVILDGTTADDVFWVIEGASSLGAGSHLAGNIISNAAITVGAGSTIDGRVLTSVASTIATSTITVPVVDCTLIGPNAILIGCDLSGADLYGADLTNADLSGADLTNAFLTNADLTNAFIPYANLSGADLTNANLSDTDLYGADLTNADLTNADLTNAFIPYANLSGADLSGADLSGADLFDADLFDADLTNADLNCLNHPICN